MDFRTRTASAGTAASPLSHGHSHRPLARCLGKGCRGPDGDPTLTGAEYTRWRGREASPTSHIHQGLQRTPTRPPRGTRGICASVLPPAPRPRAAQAHSTRVPALPNATASGLPTACGPTWGWELSSACQPAVCRQSTWPTTPFKGRDCVLHLYFFSTPRHVARAERTYWRNIGCRCWRPAQT